MKLFPIIAAAVASLVSVSAQAAQIVVRIDAAAVGQISSYTTGVINPTVQPYAQSFSFDVDASNLMVGQSTVFYMGPSSNAGVSSGTITRIGGSEASQLFVGTDFTFYQGVLSNGGKNFRETFLKAATFNVRQVSPAPVPEPSTWMMMILGFGAIGYALRRRTLLRFV